MYICKTLIICIKKKNLKKYVFCVTKGNIICHGYNHGEL
jgi:hypothetical protein